MFHYLEHDLTIQNYSISVADCQGDMTDMDEMARSIANMEAPDRESGQAGTVPSRMATAPLRPQKTGDRETGTLGKALEVLEVVTTAQHPMRFTDILNAVDLPRGTLHRHLANLADEGLVSISADSTYEAGLRLLKLAARAWSKNTFRSIAEPHLRALHDATGETVHLGMLRGHEVIYVDKLESRQAVRMHSQVGNASPLYCTGIGKAMLAQLPAEECERLAEAFDYQKHTQSTLHTPSLLLADIDDIRTTRIAYDREEHEPGIRCVAAGFTTGPQRPIGGVSVTAPAFRVDQETIDRWCELVLQIAENIENDLAERIGPRNEE